MVGTGKTGDSTLLTIASGLFAQFALSAKLDSGFNEISDLGAVAHATFKSHQGHHSSAIGESTAPLLKDGSFDIQPLKQAAFDAPLMLLPPNEISEPNLFNETTPAELPEATFSPSWFADPHSALDGQFWETAVGIEDTWFLEDGRRFDARG
ncbi:hypothetical protein B0O99DRAFT_594051 [Bisporella sp. PMI_857]|nr:hypothetical protein B0O99DRAFT_594051 [Bisporella sp. PMI_857]